MLKNISWNNSVSKSGAWWCPAERKRNLCILGNVGLFYIQVSLFSWPQSSAKQLEMMNPSLQLSHLWKVYYHSVAFPSGPFLRLVPNGSFSSNFQRSSRTHHQLPTLPSSSHQCIPKHTDSSLPKYSHRMLKWKASTFRGCVQLNLSDSTCVMQLQAHIGVTLLSCIMQMVLTHCCLCQCTPIVTIIFIRPLLEKPVSCSCYFYFWAIACCLLPNAPLQRLDSSDCETVQYQSHPGFCSP